MFASIDPVIREHCMSDDVASARLYLTPGTLNPFIKASIYSGNKLMFEMCVNFMEESNDRARFLRMVSCCIPMILSMNRLNLLFVAMEKGGEGIHAFSHEIDFHDRIASIEMMDTLIWFDCIRITDSVKERLVTMPNYTEGLEWLIRQGPIEFIQECHDEIDETKHMAMYLGEIEVVNMTKKMLAYHYLPGRLLVPGLYMHDITGLDKSIIDHILRLAANSRY